MRAVLHQFPRLLCGFLTLATALVLSGCGAAGPLGPDGNVMNATVSSYFGCGCFWHVQHTMVTGAERTILGRSGSDITVFTGYAGGSGSDDGRVCYHNSRGVQDYGRFGYAEVVSMEVPEADIVAVAESFFNSACVNGLRHDPMDRGSEYRSLVGFPGGIDSPMGSAFKSVGEGHGVNIVAGAGSDSDTSGTVYVMDSTEFPFHQAEVAAHQFHDDFLPGGQYSADYHSLRDVLLSAGAITHTGCPGDAIEEAVTV